MAQTAMSRLFRQSTSTVRQSILRPAQARSYNSNSAIPTFTTTTSPQLNEALDRFRNDLFIPLGLPKRQKKSVFKQKYAQQLVHEPITVKISENEEFTLTPKNRHELPSKKEAFDVLHTMFRTRNFSNLFPFLSGLRMSGYVMNSNQWQLITRKVGQAGKLSVIIECARQSQRTGLSLADVDVARRLFFELHQTAERANFKGEPTMKAFKLAQEAATLMEFPEHSVQDMHNDPKHQPFVIGALLELSSACCRIKNSGTGAYTVRDYAAKLDASWSRGHFKDDATIPSEAQRRVEENLAVYNGMRMSLRQAPEETKAFPGRCDQLKPVLIAQLQKIKNRQILGDLVARELLEGTTSKKA